MVAFGDVTGVIDAACVSPSQAPPAQWDRSSRFVNSATSYGRARTSTELLPHSVEAITTVQHPYQRAGVKRPAQAIRGNTEPYPTTGLQWVRFPPAPRRFSHV